MSSERRRRRAVAVAVAGTAMVLGLAACGLVVSFDGYGLTERGGTDADELADVGQIAADGADGPSDGPANESDGPRPVPSSCAPGGPGMTNCGAGAKESCCTSLFVTGGTYDRVYTDASGGLITGAHPATVSAFRLDKYEVTVGRFRQFVAAWKSGVGYVPPIRSGKHTHLNGGGGLRANGGVAFEAGWVAAYDTPLDPTNATLACGRETWTPAVGPNENLPINCVNWSEAFAFCIWDGGFLPSDAEWGYAAAGGSEQRLYPWGSEPPGTDNQYAITGCSYPSGNGPWDGSIANCFVAPVCTPTAGAGKWGQLDLAGNLYEWVADWYRAYVTPCTDCADVQPTVSLPLRVMRGGGFWEAGFAPQSRNASAPDYRDFSIGFRCARAP